MRVGLLERLLQVKAASEEAKEDFMTEFIKGLDLCEQFFKEIGKPILEERYPTLKYTAGLIGYGSDVLGYDDWTSTDHMWGPRFYLFIGNEDVGVKAQIESTFARALPYTYKGYSVNFSVPNLEDHGVRIAEFITSGEVAPLIFISTFDEFLKDYLGVSDLELLGDLDWLAFSEHRLLALTSGKLFVDMLDIGKGLDAIRFYPENIKRYLLASNWSLIAEEQAFVKRCDVCGDAIGSRLICSRIAERLMRLCFLYCNQYAPYSKWFGTAFNNLRIDEKIKETLLLALSTDDLENRENYLVKAQALVGELHNDCQITPFVSAEIGPYFGRDIKVIYPDNFVKAIMEKLKNTVFENMPLIGTLSQVGNFTAIYEENRYSNQVKSLYKLSME